MPSYFSQPVGVSNFSQSGVSRPPGPPVPAAGQNMPRPPMQAWGPALPSQRPPPAGPVHPPPAGSMSAIAPPRTQALHGSDVPGLRPLMDALPPQHFGGAPLPMSSGPQRPGQHLTMGPPPMSQPGMPPPTLPPVNPGPQTVTNMGFGAPPDPQAPGGFAGQGAPMPTATSDMSGRSQFSGAAPPMPSSSHAQMNAGMPGYNYSATQPRVVQSAGSAATGTPLAGPLTQPQPRKLDPDQMPSPVRHRGFYVIDL